MKFTTKVITALILLTLFIIVSSVYTLSYLKKTSTEMESHVTAIEDGINHEDWQKAASHLEDTLVQWEKSKKGWAVLIDHMEIDNIDETMSRMKEYIQKKDVPSALAELSALKLYLRHIPDKETLTVENIF